jgi:penicillin-binding protein 1A
MASKNLQGERIEPTMGRGRESSAGHRRGPRKTGRGAGRRRQGSGLAGKVRRGLYWFLIAVVWSTVALGGVVAYYGARLPSITSWAVPARPPNIKILANDGRLIANRGDTGGEAVALADLPPYLPQAVIAIEDRRFYRHVGLDPEGLVRALVSNLRAGNVVQGGSTITQQLAKNLFLTPERTLERKIQELILALWLEARYSKDEILEMYLNRVYFGAGAWGVDAAARRYFGKPARSLTLAEAAVLAAALKAPSRYSPLANPQASEERTRLVLSVMTEAGYITGREAELALAAPHGPVKPVAGNSGSYVADWVADLLPDLVGVLPGDVVVDTTVDLNLQAEAARAIEEGLAKHGKEFRASQGALVAIDGTGAVRALVGGRDYDKSQFNRAVDAKRQPGSAFKPFVYLAALELGLTPETVTVDAPIQIGNWRPQNYSKTYRGEVTLQTALALSINTVAARLVELVGPETVVATAHRLGIVSDLKPIPSIALGTSEVTPLEMTAAFVPFANGGYGIVPHVVKRIRAAADGKVLYERSGDGPGIVVGSRELGMMNAMLRQTLERGTGTKAAIPGWEAAGKTGTSQDYRDAWFIGYTANLTAGVWFGNDDNSPTRRTTGGSLPAEVWSRFMTAAHEGVPVAALPGNYRRQEEPEYVARSEPLFDSAGRYVGDRFGAGNLGGTPPGPIQPQPGVRRYTNNPSYDNYEPVPVYPDDEYYAEERYPPDDHAGEDYVRRPPDYFADGPMVPPADIGPPPRDYPYRPQRRGNFLERLFGG